MKSTKPQQDTWEERLNTLAKEQWDNAMNKHYAGEWMTFNRIDLVRFVAQEKQLSEQQGYQRGLKEAIKIVTNEETL